MQEGDPSSATCQLCPCVLGKSHQPLRALSNPAKYDLRYILCQKAGAARRPFPAPVQVLTWILSQSWDLGGHDEHNDADEDSHCPVGHQAMGGAGRAGLVVQGCSGMQGGGGGGEEPLPPSDRCSLPHSPVLPSVLLLGPCSLPSSLAR